MDQSACVLDTMPAMTQPITVIKRNFQGEAMWQYSGVILEELEHGVKLEAHFNRDNMPFMDVVFKRGDRFVEWYYTDRWYNIFEIHDQDDDHIKGWYCNIGMPAVREADDKISYIDLALDLWVSVNGTQTVLDEDEFATLPLDDRTRAQALATLRELRQRFETHRPPV
jgi:uncharacterized protein